MDVSEVDMQEIEPGIDDKMDDPEFLQLILQNDDEFFKHLNFSRESHITKRRNLTTKMRENAGMDFL